MDLYPTLLSIIGSKPKNPIEGRNFMTELFDPGKETMHRPLYFVRKEGGTLYGGQNIYAMRKGEWKLLQNSPYEPYELYNLAEDPLEQKNLMQSEPEKYRELNMLLMEHIQKGGKVPWQKPN